MNFNVKILNGIKTPAKVIGQVHNGTGRNEMYDCVMVVGDVGLHLL